MCNKCDEASCSCKNSLCDGTGKAGETCSSCSHMIIYSHLA